MSSKVQPAPNKWQQPERFYAQGKRMKPLGFKGL